MKQGRQNDSRPSAPWRRFGVNAGIAVSTLLITLLLIELFLRFAMGLGDPLLYRSSPLYGYRLKEDQHVSRRGIRIKVNNLGLRANTDWDSSTANKVLFLGNSVTFGGTYVSNTDLFSHLAVADLPQFMSGNGGVNGWGVENIHALVVGGRFLPASVYVTVLQEMDFDRGLSKFAGQPFWTRKPALAIEELLVLAAFHVFQLSKEGYEEDIRPDEREKGVERAVLRLKEMDEFLKAQGRTHLIYMSTNTSQLLDGVPADTVVATLLRMSDLSVTYLGERPEIRSLPRERIEALFYDWNHLDKEGHRLWGEVIGKDLKKVLTPN